MSPPPPLCPVDFTYPQAARPPSRAAPPGPARQRRDSQVPPLVFLLCDMWRAGAGTDGRGARGGGGGWQLAQRDARRGRGGARGSRCEPRAGPGLSFPALGRHLGPLWSPSDAGRPSPPAGRLAGTKGGGGGGAGWQPIIAQGFYSF